MKNSVKCVCSGLPCRILTVAMMFMAISFGLHAERSFRQIWKGEARIDWAGFRLSPELFDGVSAGDRLRYVYKDPGVGATAHLNCGYVDGQEIMSINGYPTLQAVSFQITLTEEVLEHIRTYGLWVFGKANTMTELQAFSPSAEGVDGEILTDDIRLYAAGEQPKIRVRLRNNTGRTRPAKTLLYVRRDTFEPVNGGNPYELMSTLPAGTTTDVMFPLDLASGVYHISAVTDNSEAGDYNIMCDMPGVMSAPDAGPEFETFWTDAMNELSRVEPCVRMTKIESHSTAARTVYLVEMQSVADCAGDPDSPDYRPVTVRGYYAEPNAAGMYEAHIGFHGYDSGLGLMNPINGDSNPNLVEFSFSTRGQHINNRPPYKDDNAYYGAWEMFGFGDPATYYYRGAYLDCVRAFDFVRSRPKTQPQNIFAYGESQGGALTIATAALTAMRGGGTLNSIAVSIPFMGDFPDFFRISSWPSDAAYRWLRGQTEKTEEDMFEMLTYFDTKNLATKITASVHHTVGLQDPTCPPHTSIAPYGNYATADKALLFNPLLGHNSGPEWWGGFHSFFSARVKDASIAQPGVGSVEIRFDGRMVRLSAATVVEVFDLEGRRWFAGETDEFMLPEAHGVYIVKFDGRVVKAVV